MPTLSEAADTGDQAEEQHLIRQVRQALRSEQPLDLLVLVSSLIAAIDSRQRHPLQQDELGVGLPELVETFIGTDLAETTAALQVIGALTSDELLVARIEKELRGRRQPMPAWLGALDELSVDRVHQMTHVLGDGDDYFLEARLPGTDPFVAVVYVDHNLGTVVKDAFLAPQGLENVLALAEEHREDEDQVLSPFDLATARAIIGEAIEHGAMLFPPCESETWPLCRPLVERLVRALPPGGRVPDRPEWSEDELAHLREDFFASSYGRTLDGDDEQALLESVTWFGTDYGPGDPLRWSPVNVEMLLVDWVPRKIVADVAYLSLLPNLLRGFIRYTHDRRGLRALHTEATLAAVDRWEPEYQRLIRSDRPQGVRAIARILLDAQNEMGVPDDDDDDLDQYMLGRLAEAVGGRGVLEHLQVEPLEDEAFDWSAIPDDVRDRVGEVLELCDRFADDVLDLEHRTAIRRLLARATANDPQIFRRKGPPERAAAAVCWVIGKANRSVGDSWSGVQAQELQAWFGLTGSVSGRAEVFLKAIGIDPHRQYGGMDLASVDYLTSERRSEIIEQRDRWLAYPG